MAHKGPDSAGLVVSVLAHGLDVARCYANQCLRSMSAILWFVVYMSMPTNQTRRKSRISTNKKGENIWKEVKMPWQQQCIKKSAKTCHHSN